MFKQFGGEIEFKVQSENAYLTDSGRSSLRVILDSTLNEKRFLIPDFLPDIIPRLLMEFEVDFDYYHINPDFSIDHVSLQNKDFQVLYIINYFGNIQPPLDVFYREDLWIIEDSVFMPWLENRPYCKHWAGFNSWRKISFASEGSLLMCKDKLFLPYYEVNPSFIKVTNKAKQLKSSYLHGSVQSKEMEEEYQKLFDQGEAMLNDQTTIHHPSRPGTLQVLSFLNQVPKSANIRSQNYQRLHHWLSYYNIAITPQFYSYYPIRVPRKGELLAFLAEQNIILKDIWSYPTNLQNELYDDLVVIPVDDRYSDSEMDIVAQKILQFYS